jgi:hypothetical protein
MKGQGDSSEANMDEILKDLSVPSLVLQIRTVRVAKPVGRRMK